MTSESFKELVFKLIETLLWIISVAYCDYIEHVKEKR